MRKHLHLIFFLSITILSCSLFSYDLPVYESNSISLCPLDSCQKVSIEMSMQGLNYSAPFTCYNWTDWGTGIDVGWTDGGKILFFTFPNHRICNSQYRICAEEQMIYNWFPIESCPRNNTLTVPLDSLLFGQPTLFLDVFLQDK